VWRCRGNIVYRAYLGLYVSILKNIRLREETRHLAKNFPHTCAQK